MATDEAKQKAQASREAAGKTKALPAFVPPVPAKLPKVGERVLFVLRPIGAGIRFKPKVRFADVTEAWDGAEPHPTGQATGPDGKVIMGPDGKPYLPPGCVNLEIGLDCHARKDLNEGHLRFEGDVLYDPNKGHGTWHWPGD